VLRAWLKPWQWKEMRKRNAEEPSPLVCHSHDFCDANMAMEAAWESFDLPSINADDQAQADLWNAAWNIAAVDYLGRPGKDKCRDVSETVKRAYSMVEDGDIDPVEFFGSKLNGLPETVHVRFEGRDIYYCEDQWGYIQELSKG